MGANIDQIGLQTQNCGIAYTVVVSPVANKEMSCLKPFCTVPDQQ